MSAFYLIGVVAIWALLTRLFFWKLWRDCRKGATIKRVVTDMCFAVIMLVWLAASFWYGGGRKFYYDAEVKRLCAIDGGIKLYETARLSATEYEIYAKRNWRFPDVGKAKPTDSYYYVSAIHFHKEGNPKISRKQHSLVRRSDGKILGEIINYSRSGGDFPGFWHESTFFCPDLRQLTQSRFETSIFIKETVK